MKYCIDFKYERYDYTSPLTEKTENAFSATLILLNSRGTEVVFRAKTQLFCNREV